MKLRLILLTCAALSVLGVSNAGAQTDPVILSTEVPQGTQMPIITPEYPVPWLAVHDGSYIGYFVSPTLLAPRIVGKCDPGYCLGYVSVDADAEYICQVQPQPAGKITFVDGPSGGAEEKDLRRCNEFRAKGFVVGGSDADKDIPPEGPVIDGAVPASEMEWPSHPRIEELRPVEN